MESYLWEIKIFVLALFRRKTIGARAIVTHNDQVLLVKHSYMPYSQWYSIGGGVEKGENPLQAIQRELLEEVGIKCLQPPTLFNVYYSNYEKRDDYVIFYVASVFEQIDISSPEIAEAKWFSLSQLPEDVSPATRRRIEEYLGTRVADGQW